MPFSRMRSDHPIDTFLLVLRNNPEKEIVECIVDHIQKLSHNHRWVITPPSVEFDEYNNLVVKHSIYSAVEPWNKFIPIEIDRRHFEEIRDLIAALCEIRSADFEAYLGKVFAGRILFGHPDKTLKEGLLHPWDQTTSGSEK